MKKYRVLITVDATVSVVVEANSETEAKDLAMEKASTPCLCHQCSDEVETGDLIEAVEAIEVD